MKVLQLIDSLNIGGAERMSVNICNAFIDANIDNVLVCTRKKGPLYKALNPMACFYELKKTSSIDILAFFKLFTIVSKEKPTHLHAHSSSIYWGVLIKVLRPSLVLIWHDHFGNAENLKPDDRRLIRKISRCFNCVIAVNNLLKEWSNQNLKCSNVNYIRNFPYLNIKKNKNNDKVIILHLANLRKQKDHFNLFEAIKYYTNEQHKKLEFWLVGNDLKDEYSRKLHEFVRMHSLTDFVKFVGSVDDPSEILGLANIGILSSESEGLPVSLLEYGLAGLPVVVTDVGQCAEVLENGKFGLLVPPKNPELMAEAITKILDNIERYREIGSLFWQHVEKNYGKKNFIQQYLKAIDTKII